MITEAQRAARRENGKLGGLNGRRSISRRLQDLRKKARELGESQIMTTVEFLVAARDGLVPGVDRLRAAENLLDRFGCPRLTQAQVSTDLPAKLYEIVGGSGFERTADDEVPTVAH